MPPNATPSDNSDDPDDAINIYQLFLSTAYGLVDGFNTSSSTIRLIFDVTYNNTQLSLKAIRAWMLTGTGIVVTVIETLLVTGLSLFSNLFPKSEKNSALSNFFAYGWNILRDAFKSLKNAFKGVRSLLQVVDASSSLNSFKLLIPAWIVLGALSTLNRIGYRRLDSERKRIIQKNEELLERVNNNDVTCQLSDAHRHIASETQGMQIQGVLSKTYSGIIDGLYLYMGTAVVLALAPAMFIMVTLFSAVFVLACIATRLYEDSIKQRQVSASEDRVKLAICGQELKALFVKLKSDNPPALRISNNSSETSDETKLLEMKINEFLACRHTVQQRLTLSSTDAILSGLKDGLAIYCALSALMYSAYTITLMLAWSFPAVLVPVCASFGIFCLISLGIYSYMLNAADVSLQITNTQIENENLLSLCNKTDLDKIGRTITEGMDINPPRSSSIPKYSEVHRSGFSAIGKAPKAVEFTLGYLQEPDENGRYHDTPLMFLFMIPCTILYILTLALSAYRDEFPENTVQKTTQPGTNVNSFFAKPAFDQTAPPHVVTQSPVV